MQLVPAVTELVISELLWLNYNNPEKHIYVYLNSIGTQTPDGQAVGFETEAYAILDTLGYIRPEVRLLHPVCPAALTACMRQLQQHVSGVSGVRRPRDAQCCIHCMVERLVSEHSPLWRRFVCLEVVTFFQDV